MSGRIDPATDSVSLVVDGVEVSVPSDTDLLGALRDHLGVRSPKDGCSPQGQCGCCTVLVDGAPRVACVTPVRRVRGRDIVTVESLPEADRWAEAFCDTGASQCGFCTPGIILRLAGLRARKPDADRSDVEQALLAHLCRCTGWRTILEAWDAYDDRAAGPQSPGRDLDAATARARLESRGEQIVAPDVSLGRAPFADDTAPHDAVVAVLDPDGRWTLGESVAAARTRAGKVQGRRTTAESTPPIGLPEGAWDVALQTSWVEPAYLETDASWADPGGTAADPLANSGAFGGKVDSPITSTGQRLAAEQSRPVRALFSREDTVRLGPKRPPMAAGLRADGTGVVRVARTPGIADAINAVLPDVTVEEIDVPGPPTSTSIRGAGWVEAAVLAAALRGSDHEAGIRVAQPGGGVATARIGQDGTVHVQVEAGDPLDLVVLRSFCVGASHQALSWVTSEALAVDTDGEVHDLTIRSFGILRAVDTPPIEIEIIDTGGEPVPASDVVFAAVAAAIWIHQDLPTQWPTRIPVREA